MKRIVRHFLCLLIVTLLVSAGGVAPTQTLSTFLTYDDLVDDAPLKTPLRDRLEAAYSVANRHVVNAARPERLTLAAQCCMKVIRLRMTRRAAACYWPLHSVFSRHYPEILAPPPRHAITL